MKVESKVQAQIIRDTKAHGVRVIFKITPINYTGASDIFFIHKKTGPVFVEVKKLDGEARTLQLKRKRDAEEAGARAYICHGIEEWLVIRKEIWPPELSDA